MSQIKQFWTRSVKERIIIKELELMIIDKRRTLCKLFIYRLYGYNHHYEFNVNYKAHNHIFSYCKLAPKAQNFIPVYCYYDDDGDTSEDGYNSDFFVE